jgi:hypothetical protein
MIVEGDEFPIGRNARVADPSGRLVENFSDREFEAATVANLPHDREALSVGGPVRFLNVLEDLAWGAAV